MTAPKRVLVLAGGGAKGAYAFGCFLAFKQAGIKFDAVAGTSVGALNALIWATGAFDVGKRLWDNLSFKSIYPPVIPGNKWMPKSVIRVVSASYVVSRLVVEALRKTHVIIRMILSLPIFLFLFVVILTLFYVPLALLGAVLGIDGVDGMPGFILGIVFFLCFYASLGLCFVAWELVTRYSEVKMAVLGQSPLYRRILAILKEGALSIPCYVTAARREDVYDRSNPKMVRMVDDDRVPYDWPSPMDGGAPLYPSDFYVEVPETREAWAPKYICIKSAQKKLAARLCLASAALPFGVVAPVEIGNQTYVDGGVVNNVPLYPVLKNHNVDEVFVIILQKCKNDDHAVAIGGLREGDLKALDNLVSFTCDQEKHEPINTTKIPRLVLFYPRKKGLGNFLSGTLNFNNRYAARIMQQGEVEARQKLAGLGLL